MHSQHLMPACQLVLQCFNACAEAEQRLATPAERCWLTASGAYDMRPHRAVLLSVRAICNVLHYFRIPADQIEAVQSLSSAAAMTQARIRSLSPDTASQPDSSPTPRKQQHSPPLQEPPHRLVSACMQPAAASQRPKLPAQAAAQSVALAAQGQMGASASRDATEDLQSLDRSDPSTLACHAQLAKDASPGQKSNGPGLLSQDASKRPRQDKPGPCTAHGEALSLFHLLCHAKVQATAAQRFVQTSRG